MRNKIKRLASSPVALGTLAALGVLFSSGVAYHKHYQAAHYEEQASFYQISLEKTSSELYSRDETLQEKTDSLNRVFLQLDLRDQEIGGLRDYSASLYDAFIYLKNENDVLTIQNQNMQSYFEGRLNALELVVEASQKGRLYDYEVARRNAVLTAIDIETPVLKRFYARGQADSFGSLISILEDVSE